jgi:hypothetical protein
MAELSEAELDALEALERAATPGEWWHGEQFVGDDDYQAILSGAPVPEDAPNYAQPDVVADDVGLADAIFITAARNALPALLASLRASREREARYRAALEYISERNYTGAATVARDALIQASVEH